jgi:hypothetical protein
MWPSISGSRAHSLAAADMVVFSAAAADISA